MALLTERGIGVSKRTVLRWIQTFGPLLAAEVRKRRLDLSERDRVRPAEEQRDLGRQHLSGRAV